MPLPALGVIVEGPSAPLESVITSDVTSGVLLASAMNVPPVPVK